jgi:hypothetical protein
LLGEQRIPFDCPKYAVQVEFFLRPKSNRVQNHQFIQYGFYFPWEERF